MDYKEKLEEAKRLYKTATPDQKYVLESLFPELNESEEERIRKRIIHALHGDVLDMEETTKAIAWLEKQGEQKPIEFKWSADDKNKLLIIEQILDCANLLISSQELTEIKNWLKSLKQRIGE